MRISSEPTPTRSTTLFLCGDVMIGRGIDQILAHPSRPRLYEPCVDSALRYVELAERATGPMRRSVDDAYVWGDALAVLERVRPAARIVNLETAVTTSERAWPGKGINYRMHPANVGCLTKAAVDCCVLANNHVLDWGHDGLAQTLQTLHSAGIRTAGAGMNSDEARAPAIVGITGERHVIVFAYGCESAGVTRTWAAEGARAGVNYLADLTSPTARAIARCTREFKRDGDITVASIHWGGNWGYDVPRSQRAFARLLIDEAGIDVVFGHSSHHPKGIEIHRGRPILYGCGDFLNDYEGIGGYERFRAELGFMFLPTFNANGDLDELALVPTRIRHFQANRAYGEAVAWLAAMLAREGRELGTSVERRADDTLVVRAR
jgi:poly-gamma-glutamate synthesis protein (capsule biosynthesis protein)